MKNRFTSKFNVRYPLCSAGMAMISTPELVAAVSNAGGLGVLGSGPIPPDLLRTAIGEVKTLTEKPFAVNLIHEMTAFGPLTTEEHVEVCADEKVALVVFFWQLPEPDWVTHLDRANVPFVVTAGTAETVDQAIGLPLSGIILQGTEAGGHVKSELPLKALLRQTREKYPDEMLIGAGGLANADDVRKTLESGADAVCLGTRFVASIEANAHTEYQQRIIRAKASDTVVTNIFGPEWPDVPMRVIGNLATKGLGANSPIGVTELFGQSYDMPEHSAVLPMRNTSGNFDFMCLAAGQSVERIDKVESARTIVESLFDGWWERAN